VFFAQSLGGGELIENSMIAGIMLNHSRGGEENNPETLTAMENIDYT